MNESRNYVTAGQPLGMDYTTDMIFSLSSLLRREARTKAK